MVSLGSGDPMEKLEYHVKFRSEVNETKKQAIIQKLQQQLGPYVADGTIEAESDAIEVKKVDVGEFFPLYEE